MMISPAHFVLYVDDDSSECELVKASASSLCSGEWILSIGAISGAQKFLTDSFLGFNHDLRKPCLLLLDYNLGPQSGIELLVWLKAQPFGSLPVAMFSNCECEDDILACYQAGASYYLRKPGSYQRLQAFLAALQACLTGERPNFDCLRLLEEYREPSAGQQGITLKPEAVT